MRPLVAGCVRAIEDIADRLARRLSRRLDSWRARLDGFAVLNQSGVEELAADRLRAAGDLFRLREHLARGPERIHGLPLCQSL